MLFSLIRLTTASFLCFVVSTARHILHLGGCDRALLDEGKESLALCMLWPSNSPMRVTKVPRPLIQRIWLIMIHMETTWKTIRYYLVVMDS
jgi:hypothetical protein